MKDNMQFESVLYGISPQIRRVLEFLPERIKEKVQEIRIRTNLPLALTVNGDTLFVTKSGQTTEFLTSDIIVPSQEQTKETFLLLCKNSVYAHSAELKDGYIMMRSGHRAGVCGTFAQDGTLCDITSVNIRIARQVKGSADKIVGAFDNKGFLIAGPPGSGKTTVLRDMIRQLSNGYNGVFKRLAVIDSRGELSGTLNGECVCDLGANSDVLMIKNKALGTQIALRTLFPDVIAFDEIGTAAELEGVKQCFNAGVSVLTTAHIGGKEDLMRRSVTSQLIKSGAISKIALLTSKGKEPEIFLSREIENFVDT